MFISGTQVEIYDGKITYTSKVLINFDLVTYIEPTRYKPFENRFTRIHIGKSFIIIDKPFDEVVDKLKIKVA